MLPSRDAGPKFQELVDILAALRGPAGCPWDREQDERSITDYFLEEVYEAIDALLGGDRAAVAEELGDVLMEIVFLARFGEEAGDYSVTDAIDGINRKLVRRHPHVFGGAEARTSREVLDIWAARKKEEKGRTSHFEGLSPQAPALLTALQIGTKVAGFGFDWPTAADALRKVQEEIAELEEAMAGGDEDRIAEEMGDCLFSLANVARKLRLNPEVSLRQGNAKFVRRFAALEDRLEAEGKRLGMATLAEMDDVWEKVKR